MKTKDQQAIELLDDLVYSHSDTHLEELIDALMHCQALMMANSQRDLYADVSDLLYLHYFHLKKLKDWRDAQPNQRRVSMELNKFQVDQNILRDIFKEGLKEWRKANGNTEQLEKIKDLQYLFGD